MLRINEKECTIKETSIKFGKYKILDEDFKEGYSNDSFPLIIIVKFECDGIDGYFDIDLSDLKSEDYKDLEYTLVDDTLDLRNSKVSIFELSFLGHFTDSLDVKTKAKVEFKEVSDEGANATIRVSSEDFTVLFDGILKKQN